MPYFRRKTDRWLVGVLVLNAVLALAVVIALGANVALMRENAETNARFNRIMDRIEKAIQANEQRGLSL